MVSSVAIRLGTTGKAEVKADFGEMAASGDAAFNKLSAGAKRAGDDIEKATQRQAAYLAKINALAPPSTSQIVDRSVGSSQPSAASTGATYSALAAQMKQDQAGAEALRGAIDPLYAAQKRYDAEVQLSSTLLARGAISETEHAAAVRLSATALNTAKRNLEEHAGAMGLNRGQIITAQSAVLRFTDAVLAGQSPLRAFALEAHKGVEVLSMDDGGMAGGLSKVAGFVNPATVGIAALTAVVLAGVLTWDSYESAMAKLDNVARGAGAAIGATGQDLEASAEAAAKHGVLTVASAREIETGYVQMGGIGKNVLGGLTALTADFAAATGTDAKAAQETLGKAFQDPIKGAEELASRYGFLTQAQVEEIEKTDAANGLFAAQAQLLDDLNPHVDKTAEHLGLIQAAWQGIKNTASEAFVAMGAAIAKAATGGEGIDKINDLRQARAGLLAVNPNTDVSAYDKKIADLQADLQKQQKASEDSVGSRYAQDARTAGSGYTGYSQKQTLIDERNRLANDLRNPDAVKQLAASGQLDQERSALEAYTHAVNTFIPAAEKKRQLDLAEVAIAQARAKRDPAALAAASAHRETIEQSGQIATKADIEADALAKGERARARLDGSADKHAATLAREAAAMDATTKGALAAAAAYLAEGASAGEEADARAKAIASATKGGADVDAQVRRQLAQSVAEGDEAGAKAISTLRLETAARGQVNDAVRNGTMTVDQMGQALSDEQALRELTIKQSLAQRLGLTADYQAITATIEAYKKALGEAHAEEANSGSLKALDDIRKRVEDAQLSKRFAGDTSGGYDRAKAELEANRAADANHDNTSQRVARVIGSVGATAADQDSQRSKAAADAIRASNDNLAVTQTQIGMVGKSADAQQLVVDKLKLQQSLAISLGDQYSTYAPAILAAAAASDAEDVRLKQLQESMSELRSAGDKFIDDVFQPER